jgi:hypothetical protein
MRLENSKRPIIAGISLVRDYKGIVASAYKNQNAFFTSNVQSTTTMRIYQLIGDIAKPWVAEPIRDGLIPNHWGLVSTEGMTYAKYRDEAQILVPQFGMPLEIQIIRLPKPHHYKFRIFGDDILVQMAGKSLEIIE